MRLLTAEDGKPIRDIVGRRLADAGVAENIDDRMVVLNLSLAPGDGPSVLQQLRRAGIRTAVVVLDRGADTETPPLLPADSPELDAWLRGLSPPAPKKGVLRVHDLEIDTKTRAVSRAGREIRLTRREFELLELLARTPGRVVSRSVIWNHLYHGEHVRKSNIIDVYIRYLRAKIDKGFDLSLIQTRWGEGYLLREE